MSAHPKPPGTRAEPLPSMLPPREDRIAALSAADRIGISTLWENEIDGYLDRIESIPKAENQRRNEMRKIIGALLFAAVLILSTGCAAFSSPRPFSAEQAAHESEMMEEKRSILKLISETTLELAKDPCAELDVVLEAEFSKIRQASLEAEGASTNRFVEAASGDLVLESEKGFGGRIRYRKGMSPDCVNSEGGG